MHQLEGKTAHMEQKEWLMARHQRIVDAYDACARRIAERADMAPGHAG